MNTATPISHADAERVIRNMAEAAHKAADECQGTQQQQIEDFAGVLDDFLGDMLSGLDTIEELANEAQATALRLINEDIDTLNSICRYASNTMREFGEDGDMAHLKPVEDALLHLLFTAGAARDEAEREAGIWTRIAWILRGEEQA